MYTILMGILLVGEAAALLVGTRILGKSSQLWISSKNHLLLFLELFCGSMIILSESFKFPGIFFWIIFIVVLLSHAFREYEYCSLQKSPFCSNMPLFMINNIKIVLTMSTTVIHLTFIQGS
jgi:hypothetical protein